MAGFSAAVGKEEALTMTPKEVLIKARELLAPEGAWIQGRSYEDAQGISLNTENRARAVKFLHDWCY